MTPLVNSRAATMSPTPISRDLDRALRSAIDEGDLEINGFARDREEARKLGQAMVEEGLVFDRNWDEPREAGADPRKRRNYAAHWGRSGHVMVTDCSTHGLLGRHASTLHRASDDHNGRL